MCQIKSAIILKDRIFCPIDYDSHENMIKELGLNDKTQSPNFVRVEIIPIDGNIFNHNLKNWQLKLDQEYTPEWFSKNFAEKELKEFLSKWFSDRFLIDKTNQTIKEGRWFLKNSSAVLLKNSRAELRGNGSAELWGNSRAVLRENSRAVLRENSRAVLRENSRAVLWENSRAELWGNSSAVLLKNSRAVLRENSRAVLWENSRAELRGNSHIQKMSLASHIDNLRENASVEDFSGNIPVIYVANKSIKLKIFKPPKKKTQ